MNLAPVSPESVLSHIPEGANIVIPLANGEPEALLDALRQGKAPPPGSVIGRHGSEPLGGRTTLIE